MKLNGSPELNDAAIEIYQDKRKRWRWRFLLFTAKRGERFWDVQATGSDSFKTAGEAEFIARHVVMNAWTVAPVQYSMTLSSWWRRTLNFFGGK
jgi:hypothetical protein